MDREKRRILTLLTFIIFLMLVLVISLTYFQIFRSKKVKLNSYNKRLWINEEQISRGEIKDRNNKILAYSQEENGLYQRKYNYTNIYSHIIGYSDKRYGKSGIELKYNNILLNIEDINLFTDLKNIILPDKKGQDIKLTIDHDLQLMARNALKGKKGSVVVMNPNNGEIYAMVSMPDFDVTKLDENWQSISEDKDSPLVNRAIQGLYSPGSSFKLVTSIALLEGKIDKNQVYQCSGREKVDGYEFKDYNTKGHGETNLEKALVNSCNTYYVHYGSQLGGQAIMSAGEGFMINRKIPFDLDVVDSKFNYNKNFGKTDVGAMAIGQGKLQVTPLNMALIASSFGNDGKIPKPYLVKSKTNTLDKEVNLVRPGELSQATSKENADLVFGFMEEALRSGTGKSAYIKGVRFGGKTGTAENASGKSHSWFVGVTKDQETNFAISVVLEEDGRTGSQGAGPIAKELISYALRNIKE